MFRARAFSRWNNALQEEFRQSQEKLIIEHDRERKEEREPARGVQTVTREAVLSD